jgi:hypothetical protein
MKRFRYFVLFVLMLALSNSASASDLLLTLSQSGWAYAGYYSVPGYPPSPIPDSATLGFTMGPTYTHTYSASGPENGAELPVPQELLPGMIAALTSEYGSFWLNGPLNAPPAGYGLSRIWDEPDPRNPCSPWAPCATLNPDIRQRGPALSGYDIDSITYEVSFGYGIWPAAPPEIGINHYNIIRVYGTIPEPASALLVLCGLMLLPRRRRR